MRSAISTLRSTAPGNFANRRAISAGDFRWRSALACSRKPASAIVHVSRMQVSTSCRGRRSKWW